MKTVEVNEGDSLLEIAQEYDIDLEGIFNASFSLINGVDQPKGACEASLACSTCHVILEAPVYERLPEASEDEEDMLDLAYGLTSTSALQNHDVIHFLSSHRSRLGCQVRMTKDLDGIVVRLPSATRNMAIDGMSRLWIRHIVSDRTTRSQTRQALTKAAWH